MRRSASRSFVRAGRGRSHTKAHNAGRSGGAVYRAPGASRKTNMDIIAGNLLVSGPLDSFARVYMNLAAGHANLLTVPGGIFTRSGGPTRGGVGFLKGAVPTRVNVTTAEAVLLSMGYKVYRETFDLVAVRHMENGKRFHTRIEAHGAPVVPRGAEIDVHIDYLRARGHNHGSLAEGESIRIEME